MDSASTLKPAPFSRVDVALVLLLAALMALFFWRILTPNPLDRAQFPPGDFTDQFYAFRLYETRAFSEGRLPLWSENFNSGHPFLADIQSAVFYPIALANTLLHLALFHSFALFALELEALLHFWLAGAFTYLFARRVLRRFGATSLRVGAFVSAIVFTFGGYLTSYPPLQLAILETAVWLPLALFFIDRAVSIAPLTAASSATGRGEPYSLFPQGEGLERLAHFTKKPMGTTYSLLPVGEGLGMRDLVAAGMVLGIAALAGHPQTFLFVFATTAIYFLFRVWQKNRQSKIENRKAKSFLRALGIIVLFALIAFGVAAIQLVPAVEYQQLSTREALSFADAAKGFPTLDLLQFILPGYASAFASPLYVGILPLWLALFALLRKRDETIFWGVLALGALILAFGFYVFAYVIFYLFVPGASLFRQQERLAFVVSFALAMLAGYGVADLLGAFDVTRARKLFALLPAGAVMTLTLLLTFFVAGAQNPQGRLSFLGDRAGLMLIIFGLTSLLVGLYLHFVRERERYGEHSSQVFAVLAIVLILFDLWSVNEPANKGRVEDRFANIPFAELLHNDTGLFRVAADDQLLPGHFGIPTRLQAVDGISPLRLAHYDALLKLPPEIYLPLLNVKYAITRKPAGFAAQVMARDDDVQLAQLDATFPRAWLVGAAQVEADDANAAALLANQFDAAHNALVATPPPFALDANAVNGTVAIPNYSAQQITLDVNAPANGLLVVSENFYPGWRATVDGQPTDILRADLTLRAIPLRAGQHRVEMWYDPLSFKLGAAISAVTLLACCIMLLRKR
jgi:hypothetical protein